MEVNGAPKQPDYKLSSEYLPLCSEQTHSYRFGVNDDRLLIFGCTVSLNHKVTPCFHSEMACSSPDVTLDNADRQI